MFFSSRVGVARRHSLVALLITVMLLSGMTGVWANPTQKVNRSPSEMQVNAASSLATLALTEWPVPSTGSGPWGITVDKSDKIWFTENVTSKIARFDPSSNQFTEWSLPNGGNPRYILSNGTGVYFTEYSSNKIGYLNSNGTLYEWQLSSGSNPTGIYSEQNNTVWFTESGRDVIGRLIPQTNQLTEWTLPGATSNPGKPVLEPWGIYSQPTVTGEFHNVTDRLVWFTETANNTVGMLQISNNMLTSWYLDTLNIIPGTNYGPTDLTVDSSGNVIFTSSSGDRISDLVGGGVVYHEYQLPPHTSVAKPTSLKIDTSRNAIWFTEYNSAVIGNANTTVVAIDQGIPAQSQCTLSPAVGSKMCSSPSGSTTTTATLTVTTILPTATTVTLPPPSTISTYQSNQAVTEYRLPNVTAQPNSVTLDTLGNVWFTESNTTVNRIGRLSIPYAFGLSVSPTSHTVIQGNSTSYGISVSKSSGISQTTQLSIEKTPSNLNVNFIPQYGTPPFTSTLTIGTTSSTPTGLYTMNIIATSGGQNQTFPITLTVTSPAPPSFDFSLSLVGNNTLLVPQGESASLGVKVSLSSGTSESVSLSASGFPAMTTYSFTTSNSFPPYTTTLNMQTGMDTPPGSYPITITGTSSGGITHSLSPTPVLTITEVPRDFNVTASTTDITLVQASKLDATLTIMSVGQFDGNVTLSGNFSPSDPGLTVSFSPSSVAPQTTGGISQVTMELVAGRNTPGQTYQLTVTATSSVPSRTHQIVMTVKVSPCLIATAAFGSELSPEVQFLRTFRDQQVIRTFAGSNFMTVFNAWYYSFSPTVAQLEYTHPTFRLIIRAALYPLIGILHLSSLSYAILESQPELAVFTAGIVASFLIGLVYVAIPLACLLRITKKRIRLTRLNMLKQIGAAFALSIILFILAEVFVAAWLMMIASVMIVLVTSLSATSLGISILCRQRRQVP